MRASNPRGLAEADAGPPSDYLIVEKGAKGEAATTHLRVRTHGTPDRGLAGGAHAALFSPDGYRGNRYDGPDKDAAKRKLRALYTAQGWDWPGDTKESAPAMTIASVREPIGFPDAIDLITETQGVYATISGKWLKEGVLSKNNNYYSPETVRQSVAMTQARIERNDPPVLIMETHDDSESDRATTVVGKIDRVWMAGDLACYGGSIANTSRGRDIATLILGGFGSPGVSLRAAAKKERALHEGAQVWNVHPFPALGIDFTRRPGLGEYGSVDNITLLESVSEKDVTPATDDDDKKQDDKDEDEATDHTDDEDEDDKAKAHRTEAKESAGPATQAELDAALLEAHRGGDQRATLSTLVEAADERGLLVPRAIRAGLAAEEGADRAADFFYAVAHTLREAKAIPYRGLEEYFRDHFSLIEHHYADGAGFTARDKAAFPKADYAGAANTLPIRTQAHLDQALALMPYVGDQEGVGRALATIAARKGLTLPRKELAGMTTQELEGLIDRRVEERVAGSLNRTPNMRGRDHLRSAHDHVAACLGYACHGGGHAKLGESVAPEFGNVDFGRMAEAHDHLATTLQLTCAPMNAGAHAPTLAADHNPLQDSQPAPQQAADAFAGTSNRPQTVSTGGSLGEAAASPPVAPESPRSTDGAVNALVEAVRALTQVTTANQQELTALKAGIEEAEKHNWRDRPSRQTTHNQNEPDGQSLESLVEMANNRSLDPMTRLHNASAWLQEALGVTEQ